MALLLPILIIVALVVVIFAYYYNRLVILSNRIDNSLSQIDVQLRKRADLVPNLVATVKGYAKHESSIIAKVVAARQSFVGATDIVSKMKTGNHLAAALRGVFALAENYPQLKANENFLQLQQELAAIEDKVAYSRQFYNDSILSYNNMVKTFPGNLFAGLYGKAEKEYLKIPEASKALPKVEF